MENAPKGDEKWKYFIIFVVSTSHDTPNRQQYLFNQLILITMNKKKLFRLVVLFAAIMCSMNAVCQEPMCASHQRTRR